MSRWTRGGGGLGGGGLDRRSVANGGIRGSAWSHVARAERAGDEVLEEMDERSGGLVEESAGKGVKGGERKGGGCFGEATLWV